MAYIAGTVTLKEPVKVTRVVDGNDQEELLTELVLKQDVKAKDLRVIDTVKGEVAQSIVLIAHLTGQPVKVIDELGLEDFTILGERVAELVPDGQPTGGSA